jgi:hypothetical protein
MARVYSDACLTVCADLAPDGNYGILRPRSSLRSHSYGPDKGMCFQSREQGWPQMQWMPLNQRGWALQERLLSPRKLHFLEGQIAWECNTTLYLEESCGRYTHPSEHFSTSHFRRFFKNPSNDKKGSSTNKVESANEETDLVEHIGGWNSCVSELAVRRFSYASDRFPSLSGLASAFQVPGMGRYLAGVWECNVFASMSWFPRYSQNPAGEHRAPSWSWASTDRQLLWYWRTTHRYAPSIDEINDWKRWGSRFAPQLLSHHIVRKSVDPKGEVEKGSQILISGFCRVIYIREEPNSLFDEWEWNNDCCRTLGRKVHMDLREQNRKSTSYFTEDLGNLDTNLDISGLRRYICVKIEREMTQNYPKVLALILDCVDETESTFRRAGLLAMHPVLDSDLDASEWKTRRLRLI